MTFQTGGFVDRMIITSAGNVVVGSGEASATPVAATLRGPNATGTDIAGANLTVQGGRGTGTGAGGSLLFSTAAAGTTGSSLNAATERMRIDSAGNVGIGTSSPTSRLTILDSTNSITPLIVDSGAGTDNTRGIAFNVSGNNYGRILTASGSGGAMAFWTGTINAASERLRIDTSGNVGIGTSSPATKLQVAGVANAVFFENPKTITANYTITTDSNAMAAGPITIASGVTVTIPSGSVWTVV
jgi:hypothetical protein